MRVSKNSWKEKLSRSLRICVGAGTPGFEKGRNLQKMGLHSQDTAELSFVDCRVPASNLLGKEGQGFYFLMQKLQGERLIASIMAYNTKGRGRKERQSR